MFRRKWSAWLCGLVSIWAPLGFACVPSEEETTIRCGPRVQVIDGETGLVAQIQFTAGTKAQEEGAGTWLFTTSEPNVFLQRARSASSEDQTVVIATSPFPTTFTLTGTYRSASGIMSSPTTCKIIMTTPHPDSGMNLLWARPVEQEVIAAGTFTPVSFQLLGRDGAPAIGRQLLLSTDSNSMVAADAAVTTDANGMASTRLLKMHPGPSHLVATLSHFTHQLEVLTQAGPAHPEASQIRPLRAYKTSTGKIVRTYEAQFFDHLANPLAGLEVQWRLSDEGCHIVGATTLTTAAGDAKATLACAPSATGSLLAETQALSLTYPVEHEDLEGAADTDPDSLGKI